MIKSLATRERAACSLRVQHHPKGWTPERRARQSALMRELAPWRRSTGPRTKAGKQRSSLNAQVHGWRSRANILRLRRSRYALRLAARNLAALRLIVMMRKTRLADLSAVARRAKAEERRQVVPLDRDARAPERCSHLATAAIGAYMTTVVI